jgi:hypothetical protein
MSSTGKKSKKIALKTTVTRKNISGNSWAGKIVKDKKTLRVEVNSISDLLARCAAIAE